MKCDFSGWATKHNIKCSDGRTILKNAFKTSDGKKVPLVWNHMHNDVNNILGHAMLENRHDGVYAYCSFNDTSHGNSAKKLVKDGVISSLSIYANNLKHRSGTYDVMFGTIREVSLVLSGANPSAFIDNVMVHGEFSEEDAIIYYGDDELTHSHNPSNDEYLEHEADDEEETVLDIFNSMSEKQKNVVYYMLSTAQDSEGDKDMKHNDSLYHENKDETVQDVFDSMSEKQKLAVYYMIGEIVDGDDGDDDDVKHSVFNNNYEGNNVLSHSDRTEIIHIAKNPSVGSLQNAIRCYTEENELKHGFENVEELFPEYKDLTSGAPDIVDYDNSWIKPFMGKLSKSPISRIRTRQVDNRGSSIRGLGYVKGTEKKLTGNMSLIKRTTDPQTIYIKDQMHRDDIIDITDFDVVEYQYKIMRSMLDLEIALAILVGDGREDNDPDKIEETHIRSIYHDDELYTIHKTVTKLPVSGSNTQVNFGDEYVKAESIIYHALNSRLEYKGSGNLDFYCSPHTLNTMLLAKDLNGRRIYDSVTDLEAALNVGKIHTIEQFGEISRTVDTKKMNLLGIFVNLKDYTVGCTKGGNITRFNQFDIDFNQEKYLIETRLSGALTKIKSAIVLEVDPSTWG